MYSFGWISVRQLYKIIFASLYFSPKDALKKRIVFFWSCGTKKFIAFAMCFGIVFWKFVELLYSFDDRMNLRRLDKADFLM